jgi:hypothetical protein
VRPRSSFRASSTRRNRGWVSLRDSPVQDERGLVGMWTRVAATEQGGTGCLRVTRSCVGG